MGTLITTVVIVLIGSGMCSGTEAALLSVSEIRVRQLAEQDGRRARALLGIKEHIARPLAAVVVLNNVFNIVGSIAVGTAATAALGSRWVGVVSGVLTFLIILFSEILPKTLCERYAERVSLWVAIPTAALTTLLTPVVVLFEAITRPLTRGAREPSVNEDEIRLISDIARDEGVIEDHEVEMIERVFQLNDLTARELMSPRTTMTWLKADGTVADARDEILASEHSRIVIAREDLDDVVGVTFRHVLLTALLEDPESTIETHARPVEAVPWVVRADHLLQRFQQEREHLLLVVDEYGGTIGVITLEDVVEVLTGPIVDETDLRADLQSYARLHRSQQLQPRM